MFTTIRKSLGRVVLLGGLLVASSVSQAITLDQATNYASNFGAGFGNLIDIWSVSDRGADSTDTVAAALASVGRNVQVTELARNNDFIYQDGLLNVTLYPEVLSSGTGEASVGLWAYLGRGSVDVLAIASAGYVALYGYDPSARYGGWSTGDIARFLNPDNPNYTGMTSIAAYSISPVPLPATAPLFLVGLLLFSLFRKKQARPRM